MKLHEALRIQLEPIDKEMINIVKYDADVPRNSPIVRSVTELIRAGGKRLRPVMVVVGSRFGPGRPQRKTIRFAAFTEFIHAASLIHDDIIDRSAMRRGEPALHVKIGVNEAVHVANYMMARSVELLSEYEGKDNPYIRKLSGVLTTKLCLGEYQQLNSRFQFDLPLERYLEKTNNKTALLMATCLQVGASSSGADAQTADLLYRFGECVGMAFQIRDDVLDFTASPESLGKPAGSDLQNGNVTLPVLYALEDPRLGPRIRSLNAASPLAEFAAAVRLIAGSEAIDRSLQLAESYLQQAEGMIRKLGRYPAHRDLETLLRYFAAGKPERARLRQ
ncbi:polyprenyl synthetase family protein [Paenibacillus sp. MSJ-34]|uniref:polyprenyl synthetase family protein n=1 Tax=Paenibacillus sp. MSJ-34 TaxID=2841529 RepID=UPI001C0F79B3|nr:polyprenyl synthetase family protein [Paenibacillus sp. MSJ-34]MBU5440675.1 polyprenyl synthetase family protein [Paenibacillus sp. MSJ-34]